IVEMEQMPVTANGKVDRRALPKPEAKAEAAEKAGPRTVEEELLVGIWEEVLKLEGVGVEENFFELGGHSLLATQVVSRLRQVLGVELEVRGLFEEPTIGGLGREIEQRKGSGRRVAAPVMEAASRDRELPLSYAQQRLWFIDQLEPGRATYNVPSAGRLEGEVDVEGLRGSR